MADELKLDIKYMQKLDFLLNIVNKNQKSKNYIITFGLYHEEFTGNFIPNYSDRKIKLKDVCASESDEDITVTAENTIHPEGIFKRKNVYGEDDSDFALLVKRSSDFKSYDYYRLLQKTINKFSITFSEDLPNYIYDFKPKTDDKNTKIKEFVEIPENTIFDFVYIEPTDK